MKHSFGHTPTNLRVFFACLLAFNILITPIAALAASINQRPEFKGQQSEKKDNGSSRAAADDVFAKPLEAKTTSLPGPLPEAAPQPLPLLPPGSDVNATLTATLTPGAGGDVDSDGKADPGDTISYTAVLSASGGGATGLSLSNPLDSHTTISGAVNSTPVAFDQSVNTNEDTAVSITIQGQDPDGSNLTFNSIVGPSHGSLGVFSAPSCDAQGICSSTATYTPAADYNGADSFTFKVNDGTANSNETGAVSITVVGVNDAPTFATTGNPAASNEDAGAQTVSSFLTAVRPSTVTDTLENGQTVSFVITNNTNSSLFSSGPTLSVVGAAYPKTATLTYTAAANQNGTAIITYHAQDDGSGVAPNVNISGDQTFTITVNAVNDAPVVTGPGAYAVQANMKRTGLTGLLASVTDADTGVNGCSPTFSVSNVSATTPVGGTISNLNAGTGTFDFDPPPGATGAVTFTYTVTDNGCPGSATSSPATTVTVNVAGPVIWFVNLGAAVNGDGRLSNPFNSLASANTKLQILGANERIFLYTTDNTKTQAALNDVANLQATQGIIGQAATGASFDGFFGISPPANTIARPGINSVTRTKVRGLVTMHNNTVINGVDIDTSGAAAGTKGILSAFTAAGGTSSIVDVSVTSAAGTAVDLTGTQTITYTGSSNVINSTAGIAINLGSTIGATGFNFKSVSASSGANGIVLNGTGSTGAFTVNGDGVLAVAGDAPQVAGLLKRNGSGGTITTTSGNGISLTNANNVVLKQMNITNAGLTGVLATGGSNITLSAVNITHPGNTNPAAGGDGFGQGNGFRCENVTGTNVFDKNSLVTNWQSLVSNAVLFHNVSTNFTSFSMSDSRIDTSATGSVGFNASLSGTTTGAVNLIHNEFTLIDQNAAQIFNNGTGTITAIVQKNNFHDADNTSGDGNNTLFLANDNNGILNFTVGGPTAADGNTFKNLARLITLAGVLQVDCATTGASVAKLNGSIQNNTISNDAGFSNGRRAIDVQIEANGGTQGGHSVLIANNTINNVDKQGIHVSMATLNGGKTLGNNFTIKNNTLGNTSPVGTEGGDSGSAIEITADGATTGAGSNQMSANFLIQSNTAINSGGAVSGLNDTFEVKNRARALAGNSSNLQFTVLGNTFTNNNASNEVFELRNITDATNSICLDLNSGNTSPNTASGGNGTGFKLTNDALPAANFQIEGMGASTPAAFLGPKNTGTITPNAGGLFSSSAGCTNSTALFRLEEKIQRDALASVDTSDRSSSTDLLAFLNVKDEFSPILEGLNSAPQFAPALPSADSVEQSWIAATAMMAGESDGSNIAVSASLDPRVPPSSLTGFVTAFESLIMPTVHAEEKAGDRRLQAGVADKSGVRLNHAAKVESRGQKSETRNHATTASAAFVPTPIGSFPINGTGTGAGFKLPAGKTTTITFKATLNAPPNLAGVPPATPKVSAQGTLSGAFTGNPIVTDDTAVGGTADPTLTNVDLYDSTTTVTSLPNPSNTTEAVTLTATIGTSGTPNGSATNRTGTVVFKDAGSTITCTNVGGQTVSSNQATCVTSALGSGVHNNITAEYSGDGSFDPSNSNGTPFTQTVNKSGTNATLVSSLNPATVTQNITFTFTISSATAVPGPPTGTVTFKDGGGAIGCSNAGGQTLNGSGVATCQTSSLSATNHTITADYPGDTNFNPNLGIALTAFGGQNGNPQVVNKATPNVTLVSSLNPAFVGQTVTFTGTVSAPGGITGTPSGSLTFKDGASTITCSNVGGQTLNGSGVGTCQVSNLSAGNHTITVNYGGDSSFNIVNGAGLTANAGQNGNPQVINQSNTTMTVSSSLNPSKVSESVKFTLNIKSSNLGAVPGPPTGQVKFWDGPANTGTQIGVTKTLANAGCADANSACVDSDTTTALTAGTHTITVEYLGDSNFSANSANLSGGQVVNKSDTTTTITSDAPDSSTVGQNVDIVAHVTSSGVAFTNTGTVLFKDGSTTIAGCGAVSIVAGDATCSTTALPAGTRSLTAVYSGDATFNTSTSAAEPHQVGPVCPNLVTVTSIADSGAGTLRQALLDVCDGGTISFDTAGIFATPQTIDFATALANIAKSVTVNGSGASNLTVERSFAGGTGSFSVFTIDSGFTVTITGMTIKNGSPAGDGGGVNNSGTLNLTNVTVQSNTAVGQGGGIFNAAAGTLTLTNSTVSNNTSTSNGAGIFSAGVLNVVGSTINSNTSPIDGGGIAFVSAGPALTITNSTISGNHAAGSGGGLFVNGGSATLTGVTVTGNHCDSDDNTLGDGGGIQQQAGTVTLQDTIVAGNLKGSGKQIETVTVTGGNVANGGNILVKVTAAGVNGGATQTLTVALLSGETNAQVATKIQTALQGVASINNFFDITTNSADVVLKAKAAAANDLTMHVSIVASETGINSAESVATTPGSAPVAGQQQSVTLLLASGPTACTGTNSVSVVVTAANMSPSTITLTVPVTNNESADALADEILAYITNDILDPNTAIVRSFFTVTKDGADTLKFVAQQAAGPDGSMQVVVQTDSCTVTTSTSSPLASGIAPNPGTKQVEKATITGAPVVTDGSIFVTVTANAPNLTTGKTVTVPLTTAVHTTNDLVAAEIANALTNDPDVGIFFDMSTEATGKVVLTTKLAAANDATIHVSVIGLTGIKTAESVHTAPGGTSATPNDISGTVTGTYNLIGDFATAGGLADGVGFNLVGNAGAGTRDITTVLDTNLADNGGPTRTHKLVSGGPAIDAGNKFTMTTDQRGLQRPVDLAPANVSDGSDIGAYEQQGPTPVPTLTLTSTNIAGTTRDNTPDFSAGNLIVGATVELLRGGVSTTPATTVIATSATMALTDNTLTTDGTYAYSVKQTVGGDSQTSTPDLSVTVDTRPTVTALFGADDTGASNSDKITKITTPRFTGTADPNTTVRIFADNGGGAVQVGTGSSDGGGNWNITSSALLDGTYSITAKEVFGSFVGAASTPLTGVVIDTQVAAPSIPVLFAADDSGTPGDKITNVNTPRLTGTAEAGSSVTLFSGATPIGTGAADNLGDWSITTTTLADNTYQVTAQATDVAGNVSALSGALINLVIDTAPPGQPSQPDLIAADDSGAFNNDNNTNVTTPTFTGTAEANSTVKLYANSGGGDVEVGSTTATGGTWSITSSALTANTYQITAKATDAAGNTSTASPGLSVTIDNQAPLAPSPPDLIAADDTGADSTDNITKKTTPTFNGTAEANSTVKLYANSGGGDVEVGSTTAAGGNWSIASSALADGTYQITAKATDLAGNQSGASTSLQVVIDTQPPTAPPTPVLNPLDDTGTLNTDGITKKNNPNFTGTAEAGSTVQLFAGATPVGSGLATGGNWSITSGVLADNAYSVTAQATDVAGNTSGSSGPFALVIDTVKPTVSMSSGTGNPTATTPIPVTVNFSESVSGFVPGDVVVSNATSPVTNFAGSNAAYSFDLTPTAGGPVSADIPDGAATDTAGNTNSAAAQFNRTYDPSALSASITAVSPDPRNTSVASIQIVFNKAVTGFDLADLTLKLNGGANLLTGAQTLSSGDNITWTLGNLAGITVAAGTYDLKLTAAGSNINDSTPTPLASDATETWLMDTTPPNVNVTVAVGQANPVTGPTSSTIVNFTVVFGEPVADFTSADVALSGTAGATVANVTGSGTTYNVAVEGMTGTGAVTITIAAGVAHDAAGNPNTATPVNTATVTFNVDNFTAFEVNTTADTDDGACSALGTGPGNQDCTLREAINAANGDAGAETITFNTTVFAAPGPYTINLGSVLPDITTDMTITGPGAKVLTVKRNVAGLFRIFLIGNNATASISNMTVTNGFASKGGGILVNPGTLTLTRVAVTGNTANGNDAGGGIAVEVLSTLNVIESTINGNHATANPGSGGGIYNNGGTLAVANTTISGNDVNNGAGGGIFAIGGGSTTLTSSTITGNTAQTGGGFGIGAGGHPVTLKNTIIAVNTGTVGNPDVNGTVQSDGFNLIQSTSGATINQNPGAGPNITGQDPLLNPLGDNGGPTQTHSLQCTSPAIDKGKAFTVTTDQRGGNRPFDLADGVYPNAAGGDGSDIGAVEIQSGGGCLPEAVPPAPLPQVTNEDTPRLITLTGQYSQNINLTFSISQAPANGSLGAISAPNCVFNLSMTCTATVTYTPNANFNGADLFKFKVSAGGLDSDPADVTLTVNSVNDAPSFFNSGTQTVAEDAGAQTVANFANTILPGPADESGQTVQFNVTNNTNAALFSAAPAIDSTGTLTFTSAPNAYGSAQITIVLKDNGGTANGGVDTSAPQVFTINVTGVADTPSVTNATTTVNTQSTSGLVISRHAADGAEVTHFQITNITNGTLFKNNGTTQINNSDFITFAEGNAGLKFTPTLNSNASGSFDVQSSLNNTVGGLGGSTATATITINCGPTVVTNSNDSGAGSLRDIILHACPGATITFNMTPGNVTSPITLTGGELSIDKNLTIQGPGANLLTISGNNTSRVFNVGAFTATLGGLTISNGRVNTGLSQGGGILNNGNLTISGTALSGNNAVGSLDSLGGAIFNNSNLTIIASTLSGNSASGGSSRNQGGAIYNGANLTIMNSTLSGNSTSGVGGSSNFGGGILNTGTLSLTNSTISGNLVSGGTSVGGGVYTGPGTASIRNTIVAGNIAPLSPDVANAFTSLGNNLIGANDGSTGFTNGVNNDKVGTVASPFNALLAPLGNYGGPTQTYALLPASPAIDAANNCVTDIAHCGDAGTLQLTADQRVLARQVGSAVDIGAFESRGFTISATSGTPQNAVITFAFGSPLLATVGSAFGEPVAGGVVTFTSPSSGPSAMLDSGVTTVNVVINASGQAVTGAIANALAGGPYNVNAAATGATGASFSLTNNKAATNTAVSSNFNPSDLNQSVTFRADVSSVANKTGTVQFKDNGNNLGAPVAINGSGVALFATSSLTAGTHTITAEYSGDANFLPSTGTLAGGQVVRAQPSLSINDVSITEGNAGTKVLTFTVTLSAGSNLPVSVDYATANGTATAGSDYVTTNGSFTFNPLDGDVTRTVNVTINGDVGFEPDETFTVNLSNPVNATISDNQGLGTIQNDDAQGGFISFSNTNYSVNEITGIVTLTVVRTNDVSQAANVDYATDDTGSSTNCAALNSGLASQRCDYTSVFGTLKFAANETQKTIDVPINLDAYAEGPEIFTVKLSNPTGGAVLAVPSTGIVTINDSASPTPNAIDDTTDFVRQQYRDFLNREADAAGLAFWKDNIDKCNDPARRPAGQTVAQCFEIQRITTSAAFFLSIEFKQTGSTVREFYVAALDRPLTNNMPGFVEFMRDTQAIQKGVVVGQGNWQQVLDANRTAFMNEFVARAEFVALYPTTDTPTQYVDKLYQHANVAPVTVQERLDAIQEFGGAPTAADPGARGRALLRITQNGNFQTREANRTFVQIEYFGYLRRDPDLAGYNFWVAKLNQFNGDFLQAEMVKAFLSSLEYRGRFGP